MLKVFIWNSSLTVRAFTKIAIALDVFFENPSRDNQSWRDKMNNTRELPFRFDATSGRVLREWITKDGIKDLFSLDDYSIRWALLKKIAYRKGYKKEKASETIGNLIYALKNSFNKYHNSKSKENRTVTCIISKEMENMIIDIWINHIKKRPFQTIVIDLALFNAYTTMEQYDIPINPDNVLAWSRHLIDLPNELKLEPRRIADG